LKETVVRNDATFSGNGHLERAVLWDLKDTFYFLE